MATDIPAQEVLKGSVALAALPPADARSDQPALFIDLDDDGLDPADTTTIRHGAQGSIGKASWSTNRVAVAADVLARYEEGRRKLEEQAAAEAREFARLAEWNARKTVIGGVEMTNAEAQDARQRVIDHADRYADWAVQQGYIKEDEKDAFIEKMRRKKELEDKRGRGTITAAEEREADALDRSNMGHALDAATAQAHGDLGVEHNARVTRSTANDGLRRADAVAAASNAVFQDYQASTATPVVKGEPLNVAAKVKATGLDL